MKIFASVIARRGSRITSAQIPRLNFEVYADGDCDRYVSLIAFHVDEVAEISGSGVAVAAQTVLVCTPAVCSSILVIFTTEAYCVGMDSPGECGLFVR